MDQPLLTLSMIVKNEADNLATCLNSVRNIADEIIVVDTGSTDNTKLIASSFGAKVYDFMWCNDFSAARNYALQFSTGKYILYLDADEYLAADSLTNLGKFIKSGITAASVCHVFNPMSKGENLEMLYPRLFPNLPGIKFKGKVHEQIEGALVENRIPLLDHNIKIIHTGYDKDKKTLEKKASRNLQLLLSELQFSPSGYAFYQTANTYSILGDTKKAVEYYTTAFYSKDILSEYKIISGLYIAGHKLNTGEKGEVIPILEYILEENDLSIADLLAIAEISVNTSEKNLTLKVFDKFVNELKHNPGKKRAVVKQFALEDALTKFVKLNLVHFQISDVNQLNGLISEKIKDYIFYLELMEFLNSGNLENLEKLIDKTGYASCDELAEIINQFFPPNEKITMLKMLENTFDESENIKLNLSKTFTDLGMLNEAEVILQKLIQNDANLPSAYFYLTGIYIYQNKTNEAVKVYNNLYDKFNDNPVLRPQIKALAGKLPL